MSIWVTSDHHFRHANILKYCNRDFPDIERHDNSLIEVWNSVVSAGDTVYHLGDFTLGNVRSAREIFVQLNGSIKILGNSWHHDQRWILHSYHFETLSGFTYIDLPIVVLEPEEAKCSAPIIMCHYPFEIWDRKHYGSIHFHGHSHSELHRVHNRLDVGVDMAYKLFGEYRPFSLHEAISIANGYYEEDYDGRLDNTSDQLSVTTG